MVAKPTRVYLDANATAPVYPEVVEAVARTLTEVGNPSSVHAAGREARRLREQARERVAALVGSAPGTVVFTSGGTEANTLALTGMGGRKLVSAVEHPSILETVPDAERVPVDASGRIDLAWLGTRLASGEVGLVSVMLANNETGVIQPVRAAADLVHAHGALLHCDAVQGPGRLPVAFAELGCDLLSLSAHKFGGPKGIGALVVRDGLELEPLFRGGGQEMRRRAGTENLPGIVGMGVAATRAAESLARADRLASLRDRLETAMVLAVPDAVVIGRDAPRLVNTACVALPELPSETQVIALDLAGVAVSAGSACSSGKVGPSHVLEALGLPPSVAGSAIRISLSWASTPEDVERCLLAWVAMAERRRRAA